MTSATDRTATAPNVAEETERFRQLVIASRNNPEVGPEAEASAARLNDLYAQAPDLFPASEVRLINGIRGILGKRLAGPGTGEVHAKLKKRKGDTLDHCWRCETPVDARFTQICADCDSKEYHWRVCPVCRACGCQRGGKRLV